jgi:hypothetical protein
MKPNSDTARRSARFWVIAVVTITLCNLSAQKKGHPHPVATLAEVLTLAADPKAEVDYQSVYRVLSSLSEADRDTVLRQLIGGSHIGLATGAASRAIKARYAAVGWASGFVFCTNDPSTTQELFDPNPSASLFQQIVQVITNGH